MEIQLAKAEEVYRIVKDTKKDKVKVANLLVVVEVAFKVVEAV